jgi:NAD(P)-dependent dehydrogenase (short-subunit alcohol dehydrogenase family)
LKLELESLFDLSGRVAIVTGGTGLMGRQHAEAIARANGIPVLVDLPITQPEKVARTLSESWETDVAGYEIDTTSAASIENVKSQILKRFASIDILINNAANNPKMELREKLSAGQLSRVEHFPLDVWDSDLAVGLTGSFLCCKIFGPQMVKQGKGVIVNIASDLSLISPDQRLYRVPGVADDQQPVKPITYSVVKTGLIGLTRYLATYWADHDVRVNAISPGGIYNWQDDDFVRRLSDLIPLKRMARVNEYQGAILFLCSDASSYMTGTNLVIEGGRTCW